MRNENETSIRLKERNPRFLSTAFPDRHLLCPRGDIGRPDAQWCELKITRMASAGSVSTFEHNATSENARGVNDSRHVPRSLHPASNTLFAFLTRLFVFLERLSRSTRFLPPGSPIKSLSIPTSIIPPFIDVVFESSRSVKSLTWPPDNRIAPLLDTRRRRSLVQFSAVSPSR